MIDPRSTHARNHNEEAMDLSPISRKRRRVDADEDDDNILQQTFRLFQDRYSSIPPTTTSTTSPQPTPLLIKLASLSSNHSPMNQIHLKKRRHTHHPPPTTTHATPTSPSTTTTPSTLSSLLLRPCHICHRRPTTRTLISAYTDCTLCSRRCCYVCLRECQSLTCGLKTPAEQEDTELLEQVYGYDADNMLRDQGIHAIGRGRPVCSSCAVEGVISTGLGAGRAIVRCLECFDRETERETEMQKRDEHDAHPVGKQRVEVNWFT